MKTNKIVVSVTISLIASFLFGVVMATTDITTNLQNNASAFGMEQCVDDVEAQFQSLKHHGEALGFYRAPSSPDPTIWYHYQGIQRLPGPGTPYFFVSQSAKDKPGCLNVIRMASRDSSGERLRSNRLLKGYETDNTGPPIDDKVVHVVHFDGDGWPKYAHPGGLQMVGDILAVPLEDPLDDGAPEGMIVLVDVSNPMSPVNLYEKAVYHRCGGVAMIQHAYLSESLGRFLMLVVGGDNEEIFVYESTVVEDLRDPSLDFSHVYTWKYTELVGPDDKEWPHGGGDGYQSINFIRQSDGQLFLIGTRNTDWPGIPWAEDWAELYLVSYVNGELNLTYRGAKHFWCRWSVGFMDWLRIGNFRASAGIYISPSGELILYTTEHENEGPFDSVRMGEFRHYLGNRPGSPLLLPTADAGGPYFVAEGSSITLSGSALPPEAKPWAELYEDRYFEGRSLVFDWVDRFKEDLNDFDEHDGFGDTAESVIWRAPVGCDIILYEHEDYGGEQLALPGTGRVLAISDLTSSDIGEETSSIRFTGDGEGTDMTFGWDLNNDGITETTGAVTEFSAALLDGPSSITVGLEVCGAYVYCDRATTTITVSNVPPSVNAGPDQTVDEGDTIGFFGSYTDPGIGDTHTIEWNFGDGLTASGTLTPSHTYGDNGIYTVTLTVTDDDGGVGTDTLTVTVNNVAPSIVEIVMSPPNPDNPEFILPIVHEPLFTAPATDPGSDDLTFTWGWDDGTDNTIIYYNDGVGPDPYPSPWGICPFSETDEIGHVYSEPGTYTVTLTVVDDDGGFDTDTMQVTVLSAEEGNEFIDQHIEDLGGTAFKGNPNQRKNALGNMLAAVDDMLEDEEWNGAIHALTKNIRAKADGSVDGKPADDWITDPVAQQEICLMVDDLVAYLETLL